MGSAQVAARLAAGRPACLSAGQRMKTTVAPLALLLATGLPTAAPAADDAPPRRLAVADYRARMKAGWIGQMAGVAWGAPTEFRFRDQVMPAAALPAWAPGMINDSFGQDDLYVEMTFLRTLEEHGLDCSLRQAGIDFANSGYPLWCANDAGRRNLRDGIAPPDSGHPRFNRCPHDIDYQIEADYSGLVAPGMPDAAIFLGEKFGRLMNYGDGVYAGQFIGAMYAAAFFESDIRAIVAAGLAAIPAGCQYAEMVRDMLRWSAEIPAWEDCWRRCQEKYREDPDYQKCSNGGIDCKINGAYVLMGLLYGGGDPDRTIAISCRCGQDSDCNPSSAAGVLFTTIGCAGLPERFTAELDETRVFSHTAYSFPALLDACEKLARQLVVRAGGRVEQAAGGDVLVIPVRPAKPSPLELAWAPGPIAGSRFTEAEMALITAPGSREAMRRAVGAIAPGWSVVRCGTEMEPGLHAEALGRPQVLVTHPPDRDNPCILSRKVEVPANARTSLQLTVGHHPQGDWDLIVRADARELARTTVGPATAKDGWLDVAVDLTEHAGKNILLELSNQPTGWAYEAGYWARIAVVSE